MSSKANGNLQLSFFPLRFQDEACGIIQFVMLLIKLVRNAMVYYNKWSDCLEPVKIQHLNTHI